MALRYAPAIPTSGDSEDSSVSREEIAAMIDRLAAISPVEADVLELLLLGKTWRDIGIVLDLAMSSISYRYTRARQRIAYMRWLDGLRDSGLSSEAIREHVVRLVGPQATRLKPVDVDVVVTVWETQRTQLHVARAIGLDPRVMLHHWRRVERVVRVMARAPAGTEPEAVHVPSRSQRLVSLPRRGGGFWRILGEWMSRIDWTMLTEVVPGQSTNSHTT